MKSVALFVFNRLGLGPSTAFYGWQDAPGKGKENYGRMVQRWNFPAHRVRHSARDVTRFKVVAEIRARWMSLVVECVARVLAPDQEHVRA